MTPSRACISSMWRLRRLWPSSWTAEARLAFFAAASLARLTRADDSLRDSSERFSTAARWCRTRAATYGGRGHWLWGRDGVEAGRSITVSAVDESGAQDEGKKAGSPWTGVAWATGEMARAARANAARQDLIEGMAKGGKEGG